MKPISCPKVQDQIASSPSRWETFLMGLSVTPFEIETKTRHGDMVRAGVDLPRNSAGLFPVLLGASPYQKSLRHLPPVPATFRSSSMDRCTLSR